MRGLFRIVLLLLFPVASEGYIHVHVHVHVHIGKQQTPWKLIGTEQRRASVARRQRHAGAKIRMSLRTGENSRRAPAAAPKRAKKANTKRNKGAATRKGKGKFSRAIAINKQLVACDTSLDVLKLLQSIPNALTATAGGGALNTVNFSTALHRIARYVSTNDTRGVTLSDPRFALFLGSLAEAIAGMDYTQPFSALPPKDGSWKDVVVSEGQKTKSTFVSRECSNIAWATAKLRLAPPKQTLPINLSDPDARIALVKTSYRLRSQVLQAARQRKSTSQKNTSAQWIPTLSILAGKLLDNISCLIQKSVRICNSQEAANLLYAFGTAQRADSETFDIIVSSLVSGETNEKEESAALKPQELSTSLYGLARAQLDCAADLMLFRYVADVLENRPGFIDRFKAQELSNTAWSVATVLSYKRNGRSGSGDNTAEEDAIVMRILRCVARCIETRADEFKSQELSNTAWAFSTLGFGVGEAESGASLLNEYIFLASDDQEGDQQLMSRAMAVVAKSALPRLHTFRSQELNNLAYAFARLGRKEFPELFQGIGRQFSNQRRRFDGQDISTTLWSFATLEYFDAEIYRILASRLTLDRASKFKPQELSISVWALATGGVIPKYLDAFDISFVPPNLRLSISDISDDPVTVCFATAASELMRRPFDFKSQEVKDVLWSFSKVGLRHPLLFKSVAEHLVGPEQKQVPNGKLHCGRGLDEFSPQGLGNLAWSYAKQAQLASETWERVSTGRLAVYSTICIDVGETLVRRLFNCCADSGMRNHAGLTKLKLQDMSNQAWSFAVLGLRHGPFFDAVTDQLIQRLSRRGKVTSFRGQELANIVWACASLNYSDTIRKMLDVVAPFVVQLCSHRDTMTPGAIAKYFKRQELANLGWSCAVWGYYHPDFMRLLYMGLVGDGKDPTHLEQVYSDGGLQHQAAMTLLYVQLGLDLEEPDSDLSLPENFPDGWVLLDESGEDIVDSSSSMLTLRSSRIQTDVSDALDRIRFNHIQEHVIGMDELVKNHGVKLSTKPLEILSIDMADVKAKIGIEVDGPGHFVTVLDKWSPQEKAKGYARLVNKKLEYQFQWDDRQQMNGSTALKSRLLERLGWKILHVPFWEWYALDGDPDREDAYCRRLLLGK